MSGKRVILSVLAVQDVDAVIEYYYVEAGEQAASGFVGALDEATDKIAHHPAAGSLRYAHSMDIPDLRVWPLKRYPHLLFYVDEGDVINVWRILHGSRDIESDIAEPGGT